MKIQDSSSALISLHRASELLNVHPNTLKRWDKTGELRAIRIGPRGDRRYYRSDIERYILSSRRERKIYPHVGLVPAIAVIIFKEELVLVGKRTAEFGKGEYCFVGGSIVYGETFEECAINEAKDKAGIDIKNVEVICVTNNRKNIPKVHQQSVTVGLKAEYSAGSITDGRPERIINFKWYPIDTVPQPFMEADSKILHCYKEGKFYID